MDDHDDVRKSLQRPGLVLLSVVVVAAVVAATESGNVVLT